MLLECWFLFCFSLCICYSVCPFPPYNCVSDWLLTICTWRFDSLVNWRGECELWCALTASIWGKSAASSCGGNWYFFKKTKVVCIFPIRNACELKVCNGDLSLNPVLVVCDMFFPLWVSTVPDIKSEDCSNRLHFRLIEVLLIEAFIALSQICKSIHKLEPPFL